MTQEMTRKFVGRAVVIDPANGQDSDFSAYVCLLLTGAAGIPSVTLGEAPSLDELLKRLRTDDLSRHFSEAKLTFEPPRSAYPISHSMALQRYEALTLDELNRAQTILSGR